MSSPNEDINISITFRHTESTEALKGYASEKLNHCIAKYVRSHADVAVVLNVEKRDHIVEVSVRAKGYDTTAKAITDDLYSAIDKVVDNIDSQLRKKKEKIVAKHHAGA